MAGELKFNLNSDDKSDHLGQRSIFADSSDRPASTGGCSAGNLPVMIILVMWPAPPEWPGRDASSGSGQWIADGSSRALQMPEFSQV